MSDKLRKYAFAALLFSTMETFLPCLVGVLFHLPFEKHMMVVGIYSEVLIIFFGLMYIGFAIFDAIDFFTTTQQP